MICKVDGSSRLSVHAAQGGSGSAATHLSLGVCRAQKAAISKRKSICVVKLCLRTGCLAVVVCVLHAYLLMPVPDLATRQRNCKLVRLPSWQRHPLQVNRQQAYTRQAQWRTEPGTWKMSRQSRSLSLAFAFIMRNVYALNLLSAAHSTQDT